MLDRRRPRASGGGGGGGGDRSQQWKTREQAASICLIVVLQLAACCCAASQQQSQHQHQQPLERHAPAQTQSTRTHRIEPKHNVHTLMSEQDLRRTFQVATHDQVPEYEVLKLTLGRDGSRLISPISDLGELARTAPMRRRHKRSASEPSAPSRAAPEERRAEGNDEHHDDSDNSKPIVINLSTFGREFKLRLKRNADFQQRIKDMKMFLVESTADGQLRYTLDALAKGGAPNASSAAADHWQLGTSYHDEDNLAALLVERDRRTGELQVDGTIGNDFVIKPMPKATLELLERRQREHSAPCGGSGGAGSGSADSAGSTTTTSTTTTTTTTTRPVSELERAARHMHDDDPHDDDEIFLDEDEALELAHQQWPDAKGNATTRAASQTSLPQQQRRARTLSKAASELKWRKYRKLMAQTQVPKLAAGARARRHAEPEDARQESAASGLRMAHHIVYRQRPSEHQHAGHSFGQWAQSVALGLPRSAAGADQRQLTDAEPDPLGGQFYLEPGLEGLARGSHWSLLANAPAHYNVSAGAHSPAPGNSSARRVKRQAEAATLRAAHRLGPQQQRRRTRQAHAAAATAASRHRHKRQAPDTVWPEVLLVVDYDSFLLHGGDSRDVKRYFVSFWNGVDLRYKLLVHPHIRISLAGMIVAKDRDATPYLERNRLRAPNADAVDAAGALTDMGKYLYREDRLPTYDLAVVITKLDMCRRRYEGGRCNRGTAGFAYVGGACVVNKRLEKVNSVAIIEDSGGFSGIIVAAHEVGHLLGCVHDGSPPPSYLGGPGATHCPWEDGFIMSDLRHTERGFRWSQCSVEQFKHFLNGETATCLYNYPHESQMLHRLLPGTMLSLDEQCKRDRGTNACFKDARVCAQLFCFDSASGYCVSYRPAAEGSPCGEGQVCRNGKCVGEIENIIPDYTHQSQTVVTSQGAALGSALARRAPGASAPPPTQVQAPGQLLAAQPGRLADNGLSASSASTATSAPDAKPTGALASSRRMDTFAVDTPLVSSSSSSLPAAVVGHYFADNGAGYRTSASGTSQQRSSQLATGPQRRTTAAAAASSTAAGAQHGSNRRSQSANFAAHTTRSHANLGTEHQHNTKPLLQYHANEQQLAAQQPYELYRESQSTAAHSNGHELQRHHHDSQALIYQPYGGAGAASNEHSANFYSPFLPQTSPALAMHAAAAI